MKKFFTYALILPLGLSLAGCKTKKEKIEICKKAQIELNQISHQDEIFYEKAKEEAEKACSGITIAELKEKQAEVQREDEINNTLDRLNAEHAKQLQDLEEQRQNALKVKEKALASL